MSSLTVIGRTEDYEILPRSQQTIGLSQQSPVKDLHLLHPFTDLERDIYLGLHATQEMHGANGRD